MRKDTKVYQAVSGDFGRGDGEVRSRVIEGDCFWKLAAYLIYLGVDKDTHIDKEYTDVDKEAMCICGDFAVLMSGLGASFAAQAARALGCDCLAVRVSSFPDVTQNRSSTRAIARASEWSWS